MLVREGGGDALAIFLAGLRVGQAHAAKEDIQQEKLRDASGDRAVLQRAFVRAALEHHIRQTRAGGAGKARDQDRFGALLMDNGKRLHHIAGCAGVGEIDDRVVLAQESRRHRLHW